MNCPAIPSAAVFFVSLIFSIVFVFYLRSPTFEHHLVKLASSRRLAELHGLSNDELQEVLLAIQVEQVRRSKWETTYVPIGLAEEQFDQMVTPDAKFMYVHKKTYATGDPEAASAFMEKYFGAKRAHHASYQERHRCNDTEGLDQPLTWNANFPATSQQPKGFTIHFVKNPLKPPKSSRMNVSELEMWLEKWRGNFSETNTFDQFMDSHLGLVFDSLDPLVEKWQHDGVPFICRTWCCGPGMPQFPDHCPSNNWQRNGTNVLFCEQGCYLEVPHGIIVEALCGLEGYDAAQRCLTRVPPEKIKIFNLCRKH